MDAFEIIGQLEKLGFTFQLAIDYEYGGELTAETETLLTQLSDDREVAIDYLLSQRFVPLPDSFSLPAEWVMNEKMRRYVLDAPEDALQALKNGHNPLFVLLWAVKALCFVKGGKVLYESVEEAIRDTYGFDYTQYSNEIYENERTVKNEKSEKSM